MVYFVMRSRAESRNRLETPEKYVGYKVCDPEGRRIGRAKEFFKNAYDEPEYIKVRVGLLGLRSVLIPVGFIGIDEEGRTLTLL